MPGNALVFLEVINQITEFQFVPKDVIVDFLLPF